VALATVPNDEEEPATMTEKNSFRTACRYEQHKLLGC